MFRNSVAEILQPVTCLLVDPQFNNLTWEINDNKNFGSIKQIDGKNNKVIYNSNKRHNNNNNNNNSSEQSNIANIVLFIFQMKDYIQNAKNLQELNINTVPAWKKGTTLIVSNLTLFPLRNQNCRRKG